MTVRLSDLRESNEFLNALIDNINSAVFLVDKSLRIHQVNGALKVLFGKSEDNLLGELCGNALGCAFAVRENNPCGHTSHCGQCELRRAAGRALTQRVPSHKQKLVREFFIQAEPVLKHLEYTIKHLDFEGQEMVLVIVDDVTESELQKLKLMEKQKRLDDDLRAAAGIQQSLLPRVIPNLESLEIAWKFLPCDLIGGDIFNVFRLDEEHLGCYMLDVSGHGVPSALVTVSVSQALRPSAPDFAVISPAEICKSLDEEYPFERFNNFFTIVYMVINFREGYCLYTNAGHPAPVLLRSDGSMELLLEGGPIIGLGGVTSFAEGRKELRYGDKIIFYTDGLIEHRNESGEFYSQDRLFHKLQELQGCSLEEILSGLLQSVMDFGGESRLRDDVSLLGIGFKRCKRLEESSDRG